MSVQRKTHSKKAKFQAALALITGQQTLAELTQKYGVHPSVLQRWKKELLDKGETLFDRNARAKAEHKEIDSLQRKIGQLTMENDFLKKVLGK